MSDTVLTSVEQGVMQVILNRPDKKNAINNEMWLALRDAFTTAEADPQVACLVLSGAGDNFCAGVDLASFGDTTGIVEGEPHPFDLCAKTIAAGDGPPAIVIAAASNNG